jgi:pimeloyl-ACP methyl ester carboxylesterase
MQRRELLKHAVVVAGSSGLMAASSTAQSAAAQRSARPFITTRDGTQLFYRDWGDGPAILFLGGWALPSDIWAYQMVPLSEAGLRCVTYDRRGHGRSSDPGRGFDYDTLADDLHEVIATLGLRNLTVVAHSMAGGEVVRYLLRHGSRRMARLVFVGTTLPCLMKSADNPDGIDAEVFEQGRRNVQLKDFPKGLADNLRPFVVPETSEALLEWVRTLMLGTSMKALVDCNRALTAADFRAELRRIELPVLLIHGDKDVSAPIALTARKAVSLLPQARLETYEGAPHGLMLTHVQQLNADLLRFTRS